VSVSVEKGWVWYECTVRKHVYRRNCIVVWKKEEAKDGEEKEKKTAKEGQELEEDKRRWG
jgi:hypothetical protein